MRQALEPGLLSSFRLYILVRLGVILGTGGLYFTSYGFSFGPELMPYVFLFVADVLFLLALFSWPWLQRRLGRLYLPLALLVASAGPILEARYLFARYPTGGMARLWLVFPFLSAPLIFTAWQYRFRQVIIFCLGTGLLDISLAAVLPQVRAVGMLAEVEIILARTVFFALIGYIVTNLVAAQRQQRRELADAHAQLLRYAATQEALAVTQERNRLARELHDTLAHTLSGLAVQLEAIQALWRGQPLRAETMLQRALTTTRSGLDETRRAVRDLRTAPLEDLGLALAIRQLAQDAAQRGGLALRLELPEALEAPPPEIEQCFYRVAQEALENVVRHANAQRVTVKLEQTPHTLLLEITDDGQGFSEDEVVQEERFGLRGIRERARLVGAQLEVMSGPQQGAIIRLRLEGMP